MVTRRRFECFSWSLRLRGSQRCWTVHASMTKRAKTYAAVFLPLKDGHTVSLFLPLWWLFSLQVESFRVSAMKWPLSPHAAPRTGAAQVMLGSSGVADWRAAASPLPAHLQCLQCRAFPVSCCTGCMGPRNLREAADARLATLSFLSCSRRPGERS